MDISPLSPVNRANLTGVSATAPTGSKSPTMDDFNKSFASSILREILMSEPPSVIIDEDEEEEEE